MAGLNGTSHNGIATKVMPGLYDRMHEDPMDEVEAERTRLERDLAAAHARSGAARERAAVREERTRASLHAELLAARERLADMEREHERAVARIRATAQAEVERILADARRLLDARGGSADESVAVTDER